MWCEVILNWKLDLEKNIDKIFEIHVKRNTFSQGGVLEKDRGSTSTVPCPKGLYHEETSALTDYFWRTTLHLLRWIYACV